MSNIYDSPKSDLVRKANIDKPPIVAFIVFGLFIIELVNTLLINYLGAYENEPVNIFGTESLIVIFCCFVILFLVGRSLLNGKKVLYKIIYIILGISIIFDGQNWIRFGVFNGFSEALTLINLFIVLSALFLSKKYLKGWLVN